ncbi:TIGR03086 family metal-binding protein [Nocardia brevicatena]|uniref:TIGR03086 family metal-binding protein n=1 Tax=Nocardia brevicatena TaxID=37327 RepID=UPI0005930FC4|nr:TIGR03086 family metal-binding protein [Nocardia brevicatena]
MYPEFEMEPAATALIEIVGAITDEQLDAPTPCADIPVGALLAHVFHLAEAFREAAAEEVVGRSAAPNIGADAALVPEWRAGIPSRLKALAAAWRDPAAWEGDTEAGGVAMPAPVAARVALNEIVVHTWDLARATGREPRSNQADLEILLPFLESTPPEGTPGLFGPVVPVAPDAPLLYRVLGFTGRDPSWAA